jgi:putative protease
MKTRIELLAPAGSVDALHAAVENGADAVYLGGKLFNARQQADNFDMDVLKESLEYAHVRGVSIYLTLNTLVSDEEMGQALQFAAEAGSAGIDGIIVQDMGLAAALRKLIPEVPLHGSTQMTIHDLDGVKALETMGFKRVVLARELSLDEASYIARNTKLEIEAFVHGALCVSYSGQCLMSSIIGGRSGNRGKCAQPCRLPYRLVKESIIEQSQQLNNGAEGSGHKARYLLSPKDMCSLGLIGEIAASGISSLKIEGRMKSPEYVAVVVRTYRKYLDIAIEQLNRGGDTRLKIDEADMHDLLQIFNRGGFSSGYLKGKTGSDMMSFEKPNNSGIYLGCITSYDQRTQSAGIRLEDGLNLGDGIEIWAGESDSPGGIVSSVRKGGTAVKAARKGELVTIGYFSGKIMPGQRVYKTTDTELIKSARESFTGKNLRRIGIDGRILLKYGQPISLYVEDHDGHSLISGGTVLPEAAVNKPMTEERLKDQMGKTGSTPFVFEHLQIEMDEGLSLPVSEINEVRRNALDSLLKSRADRYPGRFGQDDAMDGIGESSKEIGERINKVLGGGFSSGDSEAVKAASAVKTPLISLYFYKWETGMDYSGLGADRIYFPVVSLDKTGFESAVRALRDSGTEVFAWLPSVTKGNYSRLIERLSGKLPEAFDGILAGNIGTIHGIKEMQADNQAQLPNSPRTEGVEGLQLAGDISLNIYNSQSILKVENMGLKSIALSAELNLKQIHALAKPAVAELEAVVYGRLPLMTSEYCPAGCIEGGLNTSDKCSGCCSNNEYRMKDRIGAEFPVLCDRIDCRSTILNSNVLFIPDSLRSLKAAGVSIFRLYIWDEKPSGIKELVQLYRAAMIGNDKEIAEHSQLTDKIKASGFTKGHYYRGV